MRDRHLGLLYNHKTKSQMKYKHNCKPNDIQMKHHSFNELDDVISQKENNLLQL